MAFHGSASPVKPGMKDQTDTSLGRDGAAKRTQTKFPVKEGMKNSQSLDGISPGDSGSGPDASSPDQFSVSSLNNTNRGKNIDTAFKSSWGMTDPNGKGVDSDRGKKILAEGHLDGAK